MRIVKANQPTLAGPRVPRKTLQERMARLAAINARLARYIRIECGHFTTLDAQDVYLICRPKAGNVYCETCHKWLPVAKPPAPKVPPQTPLF